MPGTLWTDEQARVTSSRHSAESEVREAYYMRGQARNTEKMQGLGRQRAGQGDALEESCRGYVVQMKGTHRAEEEVPHSPSQILVLCTVALTRDHTSSPTRPAARLSIMFP